MSAAADPDPDPGPESEPEPEEAELFEERTSWFLENRRGPDGRIPWNARLEARREIEENERNGVLAARAEAMAGVWTPLGPSAILAGAVPYSGRVTAVAIAPGNPNTLFVGGAQGGVWRTTDGGTTWTPLTDFEPSLAIGSIAIDPTNPAIIYAGTGEANGSYDSYFGAGILKSTNGGETWSILGASHFSNTSVARIVIDPSAPATLWASNVAGCSGFVSTICFGGVGTYGVWRSTNGGASWTLVLGPLQSGGSGEPHDLVIDRTNPMILYAAVYGSGIWKTIDGGTSWTKLAGGLPTSDIGRGDLAIDPSNPRRLFAVFHSRATNGTLGVFRSLDGGGTWVQTASTPPNFCLTICWYCLVIEVAPDGAVWLGGVTLSRSTNGGDTWNSVTNSGLHVDQHALAFVGAAKAWSGNDGGVFVSSNDGASWTSKTAGMALTQFYPGGSIDPGSLDLALGGAQDTGSSRYSGTGTWSKVGGGDGAFSAIDFTNPTMVQYVSAHHLSILKTTNGSTFNSAINGLADATTLTSAFIAPFVMCPSDPSILIAGSDNVWRTNDAAGVWSSNSPDPLSGGSLVTALAFSPSDPSCDTYYAGVLNGRIYRTASGGGAAGWTLISSGLPGRVISDLAVHPTNPNIVYATESGYGFGHVFRTQNALAATPTWTSIDNGLPDTPVLAILLDPLDPHVLYVGTDLGIFRSLNGGGGWQVFMNGHPNVAVYDLVASGNPGAGQIVSFTHGRGAFRITPLSLPPPGEAGVSSLLTLQRIDANLDLTWGAATGCGATDYAVNQGTLTALHAGSFDHAPLECTTAGAASLSLPLPPGAGLYFLVTALTASEEGSYGSRSDGTERPIAAPACRTAQNLAACSLD